MHGVANASAIPIICQATMLPVLIRAQAVVKEQAGAPNSMFKLKVVPEDG